MNVAIFDGELGAPASTGGATVTRSGLIFRAGEYPDRRYGMTDEELQQFAQRFQPVPVNLQHTETLLDGHLGEVQAVEVRGSELFGDVALPAWLSEVLGPGPIPLSCEWDRASKDLLKLSLVTKGRIPDAALMAAFAATPEGAAFATRHDTPHGQSAMQEMHDVAARRGAVCSKENAKFASQHESRAIQHVHDHAVEHGAKCHSLSGERSMGPAYYSDTTQPDARHKDDAQTAGGKERRRMTMIEQFQAWLKGQGKKPDDPADFAEVVTEPAADASATPSPAAGAAVTTAPTGAAAQFAQIQAPADARRIAALEGEIARINKEKRESDAAHFAKQQVDDKRAMPSEGAAMAALFCQLMEDDQANAATVTFSADGTQSGSRVEAFRAIYAARTPHQLTAELLGAMGEDEKKAAYALFNREEQPDPEAEGLDQASLDALLAYSPVGKEVLAERAANGAGNGKGGK